MKLIILNQFNFTQLTTDEIRGAIKKPGTKIMMELMMELEWNLKWKRNQRYANGKDPEE